MPISAKIMPKLRYVYTTHVTVFVWTKTDQHFKQDTVPISTFRPDVICERFYHVFASHFFCLALKLEPLTGQARGTSMEALTYLGPAHGLGRRAERPQRSRPPATRCATSYWQSQGSPQPSCSHHSAQKLLMYFRRHLCISLFKKLNYIALYTNCNEYTLGHF